MKRTLIPKVPHYYSTELVESMVNEAYERGTLDEHKRTLDIIQEVKSFVGGLDDPFRLQVFDYMEYLFDKHTGRKR